MNLLEILIERKNKIGKEIVKLEKTENKIINEIRRLKKQKKDNLSRRV